MPKIFDGHVEGNKVDYFSPQILDHPDLFDMPRGTNLFFVFLQLKQKHRTYRTTETFGMINST